ncbi:MAG: type 1 glutamine amidotransferase domain-containing protein, partial [Candidatus Velthaea sp.]
ALDGVEEAEIVDTMRALQHAGAATDVISARRGKIQAFRHHAPAQMIRVDKTFDEVTPDQYDALLLPGGALNADTLRMLPRAQAFVRAFDSASKPIALICHAPWLLVSAGLVKGRTLTSFSTMQDDIKNAGGRWVDEPVVVDGNVLSSRTPDDLPQFNEHMLRLFAHTTVPAQHRTGSGQPASVT